MMKKGKLLKLICIAAALALVMSLAAGCGGGSGDAPAAGGSGSGSGSAAPAADTSIVFTDDSGKEITLDAPAQNIVALQPGDCEILYALGIGDRIIGRGEYCDYPAEVLDVTPVNSGDDTNVEQIIALKPDVVVMGAMAQKPENAEQIEAAGITVIATGSSETLESVYANIAMLGKATGKPDEATALIEGMQATFEKVSADAAGKEGGSIYFEVSPLEYGLWTAGQGTFMQEIADMLGLKNIFGETESWSQVSEEQVIAANPDNIVTITMYFGEGPLPEDEIKARAGWSEISAIKNNHVWAFGNNELARPGPRLAEAAQMLYDYVYGK
jgi:iron complex transport system substrate-binding protein